MIKKILTVLFLFTLTYYGEVRAKSVGESVKGNKNTVEFKSLIDPTFLKTNIFWLGESHGTSDSYKLSICYLQFLCNQVAIQYCLLEDTYENECLYNKYLETGDDSLLATAMNDSKGTFGYTKENYEYYRNIRKLNLSRPKAKQIKFISIDIEHQWKKSHHSLIEIVRRLDITDTSLVLSKVNTVELLDQTSTIKYYNECNVDLVKNKKKYQTLLKQSYSEIFYRVRNICSYFKAEKSENWDATRDSLIFENFKYRNKEYNLTKSKSFAFWGDSHTYQDTTSDKTVWVAARIKSYYPKIRQNSSGIRYSECKFMLPSIFVPKSLRAETDADKKDYVYVDWMNNDHKFTKISGVEYLKQKRSGNWTLWKCTELPDSINLVMEKSKHKYNSCYIQNVFLIVGSPATTPFK